MSEKPILFSAPMVRAIFEGRKTQTRRVVKPQFSQDVEEISEQPALDPVLKCVVSGHSGTWEDGHGMDEVRRCPYGKPGDKLYVKEHAWMWCEKVPNGTTNKGRPKFKYIPLRCAEVFYCEDHPEKPTLDVVSEYRGYQWGWRKKLGRFLPKWASRIQLEITGVRVERLDHISAADALAEGITLKGGQGYDGWAEAEYAALWESINGAGSWAANPWVWVVEFRRVQQ